MQRLMSDKKFAWCRVFDQSGLIRLQRAPRASGLTFAVVMDPL